MEKIKFRVPTINVRARKKRAICGVSLTNTQPVLEWLNSNLVLTSSCFGLDIRPDFFFSFLVHSQLFCFLRSSFSEPYLLTLKRFPRRKSMRFNYNTFKFNIFYTDHDRPVLFFMPIRDFFMVSLKWSISVFHLNVRNRLSRSSWSSIT